MSIPNKAFMAHPAALTVAAFLMQVVQLMYYAPYLVHGTPEVSSDALPLSVAAVSLWLGASHARATKLQGLAVSCGCLAAVLGLCAALRFSGLL